MTPDRRDEVERVCQAALEVDAATRAAFLADACAGDLALRREVESLLAHEHTAERFIEAPALEIAAEGLAAVAGLAVGRRLGVYEIRSLIGAGGMGEVYRARDQQLGRDVAIKVLPDQWLADPERRARFEREARLLASLNHPHIGAIYGVEQADSVPALVLELVEGPTLAERLTNGALPMKEALRLATHIADALEAAHEKGIVHRDLKPANIKITPAGVVKVLDFGLAKATADDDAGLDLSQSPTGRLSGTRDGLILGTAAYMSPEQARGQRVDKRSDIWAFGCVLYEMLTGRSAFPGATVTDTLAAILEREPDWTTLPAATPASVRKLLRRCLEKETTRRLHDIADARLDLEEELTEPAGAAAVGAPTPVRRTHERLLWVVALVVAVAAGAAGSLWYTSGPGGQARDVARVLVGITPADQLRAATDLPFDLGHLSRSAIALAPDGRTLVFSAVRGDRQQLYARTWDQLDAVPISGTEGAANPFLSPDGKWVGFWANGALKKVPLSGGAPTTLCETTAVFGATWGSNDVILFARESGGLWQVPPLGGSPTAVTAVDEKAGEVSHRLPQILPGSQAVIFTATRTLFPSWDDTLIVAQSLTTGTRKVLIEGGADAHYVPTGHLVYMRRSTLMAVPFDPRDLTVSGGSVALLSDVMQAANMTRTAQDSGAGQFSIAASGSLAYVPGGIHTLGDRSLVWMDQSGRIEALAAPPRVYTYPRLSPDGTRVLVTTQGDRNIWIYDVTRRTTTRLTVEGRSQAAIWTPDGTRVTFGSSIAGTENLFWAPADGTGTSERLTTSPLLHRASAWSPDGQVLAFVAFANQYDILTLPSAGNRQPTAVTRSRFNETHPDFSPDGRWLAYTSDESGRSEIYAQPYPGPGARVLISTDGGTAPAWARNGQQLFYLAPALPEGKAGVRMMAVSVTLGTQLTAGRPRMLFESTTPSPGFSIRNYDVTSDGRFLAVQFHERSPIRPAQIVLVQNWFQELRRRVPVN